MFSVYQVHTWRPEEDTECLAPTLFPGDNFSTDPEARPWPASLSNPPVSESSRPQHRVTVGIFMWELGFEVRSSGRCSYLLSPLGPVVVLE